MLFWAKRMLVSVFAILVTLAAAGFCFWYIVPDILERFSFPAYVYILSMIGWLVIGNLIFFTIVRVLKCQHCGARFGWSNYVTNHFVHFWPSRYCPKCGADTYEKLSGQPAKPDQRNAH